jgi:hypothetical protein
MDAPAVNAVLESVMDMGGSWDIGEAGVAVPEFNGVQETSSQRNKNKTSFFIGIFKGLE